MTFGEDHGWGSTVETSEAVLTDYLERGGNLIDTANGYTNGHSEKIIGDYAPIEETLRALDDVVAAGKVRYIGLSDVLAWVAARARTITEFRCWAPITALQLEYSLLERTPEGELRPMARALGIGAMPWSPLRGGKLTGKYTRHGGGG